MSEKKSQKTSLFDLHVELGGKMVEFAGWILPVNYPAGIIAEHKQCREKAALFDVSHMAQVEIRGKNRETAFERLVPSNISGLPKGKARYTFFTNEEGGIMDDLIVSNAGDHLFVVVNAAMRDQDIPHMINNLKDCEVKELTDRALIAIQGPKAESIVSRFASVAADLKFMETTIAEIYGVDCRISRLGYTGEDGYEISTPSSEAQKICRILLEDNDLMPAGLGARDSLRLEAGLCLYGNDIDQSTSPIEAQLTWAIQKRRREEGGFPGDQVIQQQLAEGVKRKLVGIKPQGRAAARTGTEILNRDGQKIGYVTSGCYGPTTNYPISLGYVETEFSERGEEVLLSIRGKHIVASVEKPPFVPQNYKR